MSKLVGCGVLAAIVASVAACGGSGSGGGEPAGVGSAAPPPRYVATDLPTGIDLKLSDGTQGAPASDHTVPVPGIKLSDADLAPLYARMPPLAAQPGDQKAFALRPGSQPPPRTGDTIHDSFPPPPSSLLPPKASDTGGDLRVLRFAPEGKVELAPQLSVTFSQPMVAITSQDDAAKTQPVTITPQPPGHWRWIGTRTIVFDPDVRFQQATTYRVAIAAGTKSATGGALGKAVAFTFETPPPTLQQSWPPPPQSGPQRIDAPMFALFDQKIDPAKILARVKVVATGKGFSESAAIPVELVPAADVAKHHELAELAAAAKSAEHADRWLAFRSVRPLPKDSEIEVTFPAGLVGAEGPNPTAAAQSFSFRTYSAFALDHTACSTGCPPENGFALVFNNPIDQDAFDDAEVKVTPAIPDMKVQIWGTSMQITGELKPRASYRVTIAKRLADAFGQSLAKDVDEDVTTGDTTPTFFGPSGMVVLDPALPQPALEFYTTNYDHLNVRLYAVTPGDYPAYVHYEEEQWNHDHPPAVPGRQVASTSVQTTRGANVLRATAVDLSAALHGGKGDVVAVVEPAPWTETYPPPRLVTWVQATKLGIDAHYDGDQVIAYASDLATGAPLSSVAVTTAGTAAQTATTDATGIAKLPATWPSRPDSAILVATSGADHAFIVSQYGAWGVAPDAVKLRWYVADDRRMYRPGETVSIKGWLRDVDPRKGGDVGALDANITEVAYRLIDLYGNELGKGTAKVGRLGGFDLKLTLPGTPNLGAMSVLFTAGGQSFTHMIQVEEFRRPEFEVTAHAGEGPYVVAGTGADVTVDAKYYAGGALGGAPVRWDVNASPSTFSPPNHDDYSFGTWTPWWGGGMRYGYGDIDNEDGDDGEPSAGTAKKKKLPTSWTWSSKTDASGEHVLHVDAASASPAVPYAVTAQASVSDVNRQTWTASASLIIHPSDDYVGLRAKKTFVTQGTPFDVDVIGVDIAGKPVTGAKVALRSVREEWTYKKGKYVREEHDVETCEVVSGDAAQPCHFATPSGGSYKLTATITDGRGRPNRSELTYWVAGAQPVAQARELAGQTVTLVPDKKTYAVGDTAEIFVAAPFYPAEAIVSWRRSGILQMTRMTLTTPSTVLHVPITEALVPNVFVHVDLVGQTVRSDDDGAPDPKLPKQPAYAVGELELSIPPKTRSLGVTVTPAAPKVAPGDTTQLAVAVVDASGKPVAGADVAVMAVDESVLALAGYTFEDPLDTFYTQRASGAGDTLSRSYVRLETRASLSHNAPGGGGGYGRGGGRGGMGGRYRAAAKSAELDDANGEVTASLAMPAAAAAPAPEADEPEQLRAQKPMPRRAFGTVHHAHDGFLADKDEDGIPDASDMLAGDMGGGKGEAKQPIALRANFDPLAVFAPAVTTGADGKATVELKLPDNLTRYRLVAIAAAGDKQFGKGESALVARLPLMVRPSAPRFLNYGDAFRLAVTLQNQTDAPMTVRFGARATNAAFTDGAGREVKVPPNDRVLVELPMAAQLAGTARIQLAGVAASGTTPNVASDAAEVSLPVWTPATTEAFATYGVVDSGAVAQPVALPGKVVPTYGGLEVTTSSTNLAALTDALLYLVHYPFDCAEQRSSRVAAIAALRDVLEAFHAKDLPSRAALEASVADDVDHLQNMQNYDGGFAYWDRGRPSEPYLSVYVTNALAHAKAKGFAIPANVLQRAQQYLRTIESYYPDWYSPDIRAAISAYALATRALMGDVDVPKALTLYQSSGAPAKVSMETNGWLLDVLAGNQGAVDQRAALVRYAEDHVSETAGAANFTTGYSDGGHVLLASDQRTDGVLLEALIKEQPANDLIPKLVTGLLAHRTRGRWESTQENSFSLVALDLYFRTFEKVTPDFVARVWLGSDYAGDHKFAGRTTEQHEIDIAMQDVAAHDRSALTIQKDGAGRLYYRIGMTYAPENLQIEPADYGFTVERHYESVDDPADVRRAPDGSWHVKAGARVRVRVSMVNVDRRYQVALVDPMPAGFEAMNPALAVTGAIPQDPKAAQGAGRYWWYGSTWFEHQNLRDERAEAFASLVWEGVHEYTYVARATTRGNFVVPPPKAEEMYAPETFGRGASDRVTVE